MGGVIAACFSPPTPSLNPSLSAHPCGWARSQDLLTRVDGLGEAGGASRPRSNPQELRSGLCFGSPGEDFMLECSLSLVFSFVNGTLAWGHLVPSMRKVAAGLGNQLAFLFWRLTCLCQLQQ